jgi:pimeloyl-ACP methyl ester carboxylesterase
VRTAQGVARAHLRYYYFRRLLQASLWQKLARGEVNFREAPGALVRFVLDAMRPRAPVGAVNESSVSEASLPHRMGEGLRKFHGRVLLILSGNDLTSQEFRELVARSAPWRRLLAGDRVTRYDLPGANHTFARRDWRDQVERWTETWVKNL